MLTILVSLTVLLFLAGLFFVLRGSLFESDDDVIPISDVTEIQGLDKVKAVRDKKVQIPYAILREIAQEKKSTVQPSAGSIVSGSGIITSEDVSEKEKLKEALKEQSAALADAKTALQAIRKQNDDMAQRMEVLKSERNRFEESLARFQSGLQLSQEKEQAKIAALESELEKILSRQGDDIPQELLNQLKSDKKTLTEKVAKYESTVNELNGQLDQFRRDMEAKSESFKMEKQALDQQIRDLEQKNQSLVAESEKKTAVDQATTDVRTSAEHSRLLSENAELLAEVQKLKSFNEQLLAKERMLQYELTKSRAESFGLEKICEDFKVQINRLSRWQESPS